MVTHHGNWCVWPDRLWMMLLLFDSESVYHNANVFNVAVRRRLTVCKGGLLVRGSNEEPK